MTKPEGPKGYVAHKFVVSGNGNKCGVCGVAHNGDASTWVPDVPATPVPSQPAARELDQLITDIENAICYPPPHPDVSAEWSKRLKPLLEAWTAAKDAEIVWLRKERHRHVEALEAAERERDSLATKCKNIRRLVAFALRNPKNITQELLGQIDTQANAALKAGKEGMK